MARPPSTGPTRTAAVPVRYLPTERRFVDAAREKEYRQTLRALGVGEYSLSEFIRAASMERAERILGMNFEEFEAKDRRKER
jgi:hypothetical protein